MITTTDVVPLAGMVGGGFFVGLVTGYAIKKVLKLAAIIIGLFIAALAYFEYQRVINVDWNRVQLISQNGFTWVTNAITHVSNTIGAHHSESISNVGIPLFSSASVGLTLGLVKG